MKAPFSFSLFSTLYLVSLNHLKWSPQTLSAWFSELEDTFSQREAEADWADVRCHSGVHLGLSPRLLAVVWVPGPNVCSNSTHAALQPTHTIVVSLN